MTGNVPVFVHADDPAEQEAVLHALMEQDGILVVNAVEDASWAVLSTSVATGARLVAFVTSAQAPRPWQVVSPALAALAPAQDGRPEAALLRRRSIQRLASAMTRSASSPSPLAPREEAVFRLVADGHTTSEIAAVLSYSERSVKNVIRDVTERLGLRNRCHAVAHAVRETLDLKPQLSQVMGDRWSGS